MLALEIRTQKNVVTPLIDADNYHASLLEAFDALQGDAEGGYVFVAGLYVDPNTSLSHTNRQRTLLSELTKLAKRAKTVVRILASGDVTRCSNVALFDPKATKIIAFRDARSARVASRTSELSWSRRRPGWWRSAVRSTCSPRTGATTVPTAWALPSSTHYRAAGTT